MENKIVVAILFIFLVSLIACQKLDKTGTTSKTSTTGTGGDAAVDAVGQSLSNTDDIDKDLSADNLSSLDSGLSDVQSIW